MIADQQCCADDADDPRDEVIIEARDAEREAEYGNVQSVVTETACNCRRVSRSGSSPDAGSC